MQYTWDKIQEFISYVEYYIESIVSGVHTKIVFTALGGAFFWLIGDITPAVISFVIIYLIDFFLGVGISLYKNNFNPSRFFAWIVKLWLYFFLVILAHQFDIVIAEFTSLWMEHWIGALFAKYWVIGYLATHEFLSSLVKMESIGIPVPSGLIKRIKSTKKRIDEIT
jgi:phage-related holin